MVFDIDRLREGAASDRTLDEGLRSLLLGPVAVARRRTTLSVNPLAGCAETPSRCCDWPCRPAAPGGDLSGPQRLTNLS